MNNTPQKGTLKRWNDDKGFGFIESANSGGDIFIHISALKRMTRRPNVGDIIIYEIHTEKTGKKRAVNAKIEGIEEITPNPAKRKHKHKNSSNWLSKTVPLVLVILMGSAAYQKFIKHNESYEAPTESPPSYTNEIDINYRCEGKVFCSEMTSCDEALFYQRNCKDTKMDGDGDGIPCESQWCGH